MRPARASSRGEGVLGALARNTAPRERAVPAVGDGLGLHGVRDRHRGDDVRVIVVDGVLQQSFSTSSAPRLEAIVSSSASETVRLSERYTLLARSASELLPLLEMRDGVLSELNWRDGVLRATGRGLASSLVVNAPAKETRMRSRTASGVAVQVAVVDARKPADYAKHHVDGAVNVPASTKDLATITGLPENKSTPIVCHCAVGGEAAG